MALDLRDELDHAAHEAAKRAGKAKSKANE